MNLYKLMSLYKGFAYLFYLESLRVVHDMVIMQCEVRLSLHCWPRGGFDSFHELKNAQLLPLWSVGYSPLKLTNPPPPNLGSSSGLWNLEFEIRPFWDSDHKKTDIFYFSPKQKVDCWNNLLQITYLPKSYLRKWRNQIDFSTRATRWSIFPDPCS